MKNMSSDEKKELYNRLNKLDVSLSRILFILESDSKTNQSGLVETVKKLETRIEVIETEKKLLMAKVTAYGAIGSGIVIFIGWMINLALKFVVK